MLITLSSESQNILQSEMKTEKLSGQEQLGQGLMMVTELAIWVTERNCFCLDYTREERG